MNPTILELFAKEPNRSRDFRVSEGDWYYDFSHLPLSIHAKEALLSTFLSQQPAQAIDALFGGEMVNGSEAQPALHARLRSTDDAQVQHQKSRFLAVAERLYTGQSGLTDLIHIGIGGSDLGPRLVADALDAGHSAVNVHWLATADGRRLKRLMSTLNPETTGLVIASKSFSTEETLAQAEHLKTWLGERFANQVWAATANPERAQAFGVPAEHVLSFPHWTGGRFSLWSSVGVSAAAVIGTDAFQALLDGAHEADQRYQQAPNAWHDSLAVWIALSVDHLRRGLDLTTLGVVSYEPRLALLGDYCQQLFMESLGKRVDVEDQPISAPTVPLIFGGRGTDLQHSIFQALHQGMDTHPLLLVGALHDPEALADCGHIQMAHLLAQRQAFAQGRGDGAAYQHMPGNRPVALLLTDQLSAQRLGFLLASLEHAVYSLSVLWGINAFDQWGVEEGKRLAGPLRKRLESHEAGIADLLDWDLNHH